jgi:hypothetical protein
MPSAQQQVQVRRIRRQELQIDVRVLQLGANGFGAIVAGFIAEHADRRGFAIDGFDLCEPRDIARSMLIIDASHNTRFSRIRPPREQFRLFGR